MLKITVGVDGMMCGMCESHINDAIRKAFSVKKVTSSHSKGQTVILTEQDIDEAEVRKAIDATGYTVTSFAKEPYEKKGLFSFLHK
ncbi:heavy-metal-associated domain-containing protein [uncultured Agathobaculum sp.]|uniref:heavy-metal-associated domain-containing protein n=1 Tax=uncultured Agathobaculum sp. TaxID=2048140 RepID=UPI00296E51F0